MDETSWLVSQYMNGFQGDDESGTLISEHIGSELDNLPAKSLQERLNLLYFNTRNQAHFGHLRRSMTSNELPLHVLSNPFLLRASALLEPRSRHEGKLIKDLFRILGHADMMTIQFESPFDAGLENIQKVEVHDKEWEEDFDRISKKVRPTRSLRKWRLNARDRLSAAQLRQAAENYIIVSMNILAEIDRNNYSFHDEIRRITVNRVKLNKVPIGPLVAKVASALDVFFPGAQSGPSFELETDGYFSQQPYEVGRALKAHPPAALVFGTRGMTHEPKAISNGSRLYATANLWGAIPDDIEFAFYLKEDGLKVDERWYSPEPDAEFEVSHLVGELTVESFVRLKNIRGVPLRTIVTVSSDVRE